MRVRPLYVLVALPLLLAASAEADYARQWPLALQAPASPAHEVVLDADVYRAMHDRAGRDVDVLDARGTPQPSLLSPPPPPRVQQARVALPYFTLPVVAGDATGSRLVAETDSAGQLRRVELRGGVEVPGMPNEALLLDLAPARGTITALELHWQPSGPVDRGYSIDASDDLQEWTPVAARGRVVDLAGNGRRLVQRRLVFDAPPNARFLRLSPEVDGRRLHLHRVDALIARSIGPAVQWLTIPAQPRADDGAYRFRLAGRVPVEHVDVRLPGTGAMRWRLESRDAGDADWRTRASGSAFDVPDGASRRRPPPLVLAQPVRDREWRLVPLDRANAAPALRLGYRPERLVFLAQGTPPYRLVAGSAHVRRVDAPVGAVIDELRRSNGAAWSPPTARIGAARPLAGEAALAPKRDWTTWTLWAVLGIGVLVVAGFALRLLREPPRA
ncbi:DUF3999 family protein [Lysobacter humi (ex Lee et al. 2017)]